MDPKPSIEHLAISRAGSAVLGIKYHRDINIYVLFFICYLIVHLIVYSFVIVKRTTHRPERWIGVRKTLKNDAFTTNDLATLLQR